LLLLATLALLLVTTTALAVTGGLTQPAGAAGCVSETGSGHCADGHALTRAGSVAISPDGKSVYVASLESDAVTRFNRDTATGWIAEPAGTAGCISETGAGPCANGHGLTSPDSVAVSSDGKSVYVVSGDGVVRLNRSLGGAITQPAGTAGCISETGAGPCADGHALRYPSSVAVSPDGKSVYVTSSGSNLSNSAVVRLVRNTTTGAISQPAGVAGCISETGAGPCADGHALKVSGGVAVSPDGKSVYVISSYAPGRNGAVVRLVRNTTTGAITQPAGTAGCISQTGAGPCADGHALEEPWSVAASPDGKSVYVTARVNAPEDSAGAVVRLIRNTTTGAISQPAGIAGCISSPQVGSADSSWTGCAEGHAVSEGGVTVSPDGKSVYIASFSWSAVARLVRNTTTGAISQPTGIAGCVSETGAGTCADGHALDGARSVAVSPDGKSIYVASSYPSNAVARFNRAP
jgi:DNA-binding beta-propeller fold protein YncE